MISAVVLTKNEEKNITDCLTSLSWCDEVIVIDDQSTDKTVELAHRKGARIFVRALNHDFSEQRNYGLKKAKGEWVLFVDSDELVSSALWYEIMQYTNDPIAQFAGFYLKRTDFIWGKQLKHGETGNIKLLRLAKKNSGLWKGRVHEVWEVPGKKGVLENPLIHYPHATVKDFLRDINYYTDLRSKELFDKKMPIGWWSIVIFPSGKFIYNYILKRGIMDGAQGLVFAMLMSFHSFLARGKLWLLWQNRKAK